MTSFSAKGSTEMVKSRVAYEIRVVGDVAPRLLEDFERVTMSVDVVGTTMLADFADGAELHGFLAALRRGGLVLVDVRRCYGDEGSTSEGLTDQAVDPTAGRQP